MLTNLANYLNNDFPFHMFFAVQILLAEGPVSYTHLTLPTTPYV